MHRFRTPILLALCAALAAAEGATRLSRNGEMPRPEETAAAWDRQAEEVVPAGSIPHFTGAYLWRGRADRNYKAFHQWELRLAGGETALAGLRLRILSLSGALEPHPNGTGHWVRLGGLADGAELDLSYKLNCGQPTAYRVELAWEGGGQAYLCSQLTGLPQPEAEGVDAPQLVVLGARHDYTNRRNAIVTYRLRNIGGAAAEGVRQTIHFLDEKGATLFEHEHLPGEDGVVPAGYNEVQRVVLRRAKPFHAIRITTEQAGGDGGFVLDPGAFTDAAEVEVAEFRLVDGRLTATVRNGTADPLADLQITFQLLDGEGGVLRELTVPVERLGAGEKAPLAAEVGAVEGVASWGVAFGLPGAGDAEPGGGAAGIVGLEVAVSGLDLEVLAVAEGEAGTELTLRLINNTGGDLTGLSCTLQVGDAAGQREADLAIGDLGAGASVDETVTVAGLGTPTGLGMSWESGAQQ